MALEPRLVRKRTLLERHWPWLVLSLLGLLVFSAVLLVLHQGLLSEISEYLSSTLRGYTLVGTLLGVLSVALILFEAFYSWRKRALQELMPIGRASMVSWLWAHVYVGLFALIT